MAGPATNIATIIVLWKTLGRKATIIYLLNIIIGSFIFAWLFDNFFPAAGSFSMSNQHVHTSIDLLHIGGSILLGMLLIYSYGSDLFNYVLKK